MRIGTQWTIAAALAALWLAMLLGGGGPVDRGLLFALHSGEQPGIALAAAVFTFIGNGTSLIPITLAAAAWIAYRHKPAPALVLLASTLTGRMLVVLQKLWFARLRPDEELRLVDVHYLSFPSGHAANSAMVFVAIALLLPAPRHRAVALWAAALLSLLVGLSRPMLGVHWPSDVVAGWAFGILWLILSYRAAVWVVPRLHLDLK